MDGAGALDRLPVPVWADATEGVVLDGPEAGLVELMVAADEPTVKDPPEPVLFARGEPGVLTEAPLEVLGTVEPVVGFAAAVLDMPFAATDELTGAVEPAVGSAVAFEAAWLGAGGLPVAGAVELVVEFVVAAGELVGLAADGVGVLAIDADAGDPAPTKLMTTGWSLTPTLMDDTPCIVCTASAPFNGSKT